MSHSRIAAAACASVRQALDLATEKSHSSVISASEGSRLMIVLVAAMMLVGSGADVRHDFVACLKTAQNQAEQQKIGADGFVNFARTACASAEQPFKAALVNANVQHGMSRKDSASDANQQVSDYYHEWNEKYAADAPPPSPAKVTPPPPTPASAPTEPK
jgi:hypothetical protein